MMKKGASRNTASAASPGRTARAISPQDDDWHIRNASLPLTARACMGAWSTRLSILVTTFVSRKFLTKAGKSSSVRDFLDTNVVTSMDNLVDQAPMQALAVSGKLAFLMCQSSSCGEIALAVLPGEAALAVFLDAPFFIIVLRVVVAALAVQLALEAPFLTRIGPQFLAQG